ncbi:transporter [Micromonosporaceae bacterium Da 78-11]
MTPIEDDLPLTDPAESLRLIEHERAHLERSLTPDPRLMLWPWGFAWLIGFALFFLRYGPDGRVLVDLPGWLPLTVLMGLLFAAGITTGVASARSGRQVAGQSSRQGLMYGLTWSAAFAGMTLVFSQLSGYVPDAQLNLLWAGGLVALTGALHMAGGAIWDDRSLFLLGAGISVVNAVGVIAGIGWHSLIVAVAGGGGMIVAGLIGWLKLR